MIKEETPQDKLKKLTQAKRKYLRRTRKLHQLISRTRKKLEQTPDENIRLRFEYDIETYEKEIDELQTKITYTETQIDRFKKTISWMEMKAKFDKHTRKCGYHKDLVGEQQELVHYPFKCLKSFKLG